MGLSDKGPILDGHRQKSLQKRRPLLGQRLCDARNGEQSGRWLGVAHNIGDALTFWILDDQSKQVLARSVLRPYQDNVRVKWDPAFITAPIKHTAQNGGDIMPPKESSILNTVMDKYDEMEADPEPDPTIDPSIQSTTLPQPILRNNDTHHDLDIHNLVIPKDETVFEHRKTKLCLDNVPVPMNGELPTFNRTGKLMYSDVNYSKDIAPPTFKWNQDGVKPKRSKNFKTPQRSTKSSHGQKASDKEVAGPGPPRRSERIKSNKARTTWKPTKIVKAMLTATLGIMLLPTSIYAEPAVPMKELDKHQ